MKEQSQDFVSEKFDSVVHFRDSLDLETDRGCGLMAAEYLSTELAELIAASFIDDKEACREMVCNKSGPLSSFSARIEFAYLMGLISRLARRELNLVRKIRNEFAHSYKPLAFTEQSIASRCLELTAHNIEPVAEPRVNFVRNVLGLLATLHARIRFVVQPIPCPELKLERENLEASVLQIAERLSGRDDDTTSA